MRQKIACALMSVAIGLFACHADAATFEFDTGFGPIQAAWVSNLTAGIGLRLKNPSCSLTGDPDAYGCGSSANTAQWANGDDGDLNYKRNRPFTAYVSTTSEVLLTAPEQGLKALIRGTAQYDGAADHTQRTALSDSAKGYVKASAQVLDLWIEKDFAVGDRQAHFRVGNQVINWGESYFASGGINATNSVDIQKLLVPGTQLKQALLPAPMLEFASGLPAGFSTEAYLQVRWNANRYPPVGTYFSISDVYLHGAQPASYDTSNFNLSGLDAGTLAGRLSHNRGTVDAINQALVAGQYPFALGVPYATRNPANTPQFGARLNYTPPGAPISFSAYYENYTDKSPVLSYFNYDSAAEFTYLKRRQLFGLSTNFPVGNWAIGAELSYRPRDAIALSSCFLQGGAPDASTNLSAGTCKAYKDEKKGQFDVNAQINPTQTTFAPLRWIGATQGLFTGEVTYVKYFGVSPNSPINSTIDGQAVYQLPAAGYAIWLQGSGTPGYSVAKGQGTSNSVGLTLDANVTYDGNLIPGWAVTPGVTFYDAVYGYTPTFSANYLKGAKSINAYVLFNQNPSVWQAGINATFYFGGNQLAQPYSDRNFVGGFITRNF